ncbi:MAG TPA: cytochrome b N-terminal domain-containing protein, partial [Candidatus Limnocylindrales bacterium]
MTEERPEPTKTSPAGLHGWLQDRLDVDGLWATLFARKIPLGVNWFYTLGFVSMALFVIQAITGSVLAMYYAPSPDHAYDSINYIMNDVPFGQVIRGIHHWTASAMILIVVLHLIVVFAMGAYKYPREATWVVGVFLLIITFGFGFTGYLLPWDERAYWATTVGTNMAGTVPVIGGMLVRLLRGGAELGVLTLSRFYAAHVLLLPLAIVAMIAIHVFMVIRQGVSVPPSLWDRWVAGKLDASGRAAASRQIAAARAAY